MLQALMKSSHLANLIEDCNQLVLDTLRASSFREAQIALESFSRGGKRLRPALMLLSSRLPERGLLNTMDTSLVSLAGAIELIHLATLFHDDVIDEVDIRRGSESAKSKYGNYASVLAGDFALAEALMLVQQSGLHHTMPEFLRTIRVLVRGESRETQHKFDFDMSDAVYYEIISEKSASLFSLSCKVGVLSIHSEYSDTLGHFGWNLGMAFQMIDDLDDMLHFTNGSNDCDLKNGYLSLPVIRALGHLEDGHREGLISIIRGGDFSPENERYIASLCNELATVERTRNEIHEHLRCSAEILERFPECEAANLLGMILSDLKAYSDAQLDNYQRFTEAGNYKL